MLILPRFVVLCSVFLVWMLPRDHVWAQTDSIVELFSDKDLEAPFGVDFDRDENLWLVEFDGGRVSVWSETDGFQVVAGSPDLGYADGKGNEVRFNKLHNLAIADNGKIYLSDHQNHAVRVLDTQSGVVSTFAGTGEAGFSGDGGPARQAQFDQPISITLSPDQTKLYVADIRNRRIRSIDLKTNVISTFAGSGKKGKPADGSIATDAPLIDPRAVAVADDGRVFIAERNGNAFRVVENGKIRTIAGSGKKGSTDGTLLEATFNGPKHIEFIPDERIFVADDMNHLIRVIDLKSQVVSTLPTGDFKLKRPHGVKVHNGMIYLSDSMNHRVLKMKLPQRD